MEEPTSPESSDLYFYIPVVGLQSRLSGSVKVTPTLHLDQLTQEELIQLSTPEFHFAMIPYDSTDYYRSTSKLFATVPHERPGMRDSISDEVRTFVTAIRLLQPGDVGVPNVFSRQNGTNGLTPLDDLRSVGFSLPCVVTDDTLVEIKRVTELLQLQGVKAGCQAAGVILFPDYEQSVVRTTMEKSRGHKLFCLHYSCHK